MYKVTNLLSELLKIFPRYEFEKLEEQYNSNHYTKYFTGWQQFIAMLFSQIRGIDSHRDLELSLNMYSVRWYHIGFRGVKRSTLSDSLSKRDYRLYEGLFYKLLDRCKLLTPRHKFRFKNSLLLLDTTLIDLCLSLFPWARYRKRKGGIKLHYLYEHSSSLPTFITITEGRVHDIRVARGDAKLDFNLLPDSIITFDKAYIDFKWLYLLTKRRVWFVSRAKSNMDYEVVGQHKPIKHKSIISDVLIKLVGLKTRTYYPEALRLIGYIDEESGRYYEFMTNNMSLSAKTIADIYHERWQIELFFKWIKQNLKIKSFLGTSRNAVLTQIWISMCYYLLLAFIKHQTKFARSLTVLSQMIREVVMERISLIDILSLDQTTIKKAREPDYQLSLF